MGYKKIILKSDNEPALIAFKEAVKDTSKVEINVKKAPLATPRPMET